MCVMCDDPVPGDIPGDPDTVNRFATTFTTTSEALRDAARGLRAVANENITISLAIDEVRTQADQVVADTYRVADRYEGAGTTFANYAAALDDARRNGNGARADIIANNESGRYWRHRERDLRFMVQMGNTDPEVHADFQEATRRTSYYDSQFAALIGRYSAAVEAKDSAVRAAMAGLDDAEAAAGLNDEFFDRILGDLELIWELASKYLGPVLEILRDVLERLKKIVDLLALIFTVLAIFFPAFAAIAGALAAISAIIGIAIFAISLVLFLMGRETLGRVLADGIMAVVGVVTAKLNASGWAKDSLGTMVNKGVNAVSGTSKTVLLAPASDVGARLYTAVGESAIHSVVEATGEIFAYPAGEGLDFELGMAWGDPAFDMSGADPSSMLFSIANVGTLGLMGHAQTAVEGVQGMGEVAGFAVDSVTNVVQNAMAPQLLQPSVRCGAGG